MDMLIIGILFAVAVVFLVCRYVAIAKGKKDLGCSCESCSHCCESEDSSAD